MYLFFILMVYDIHDIHEFDVLSPLIRQASDFW